MVLNSMPPETQVVLPPYDPDIAAVKDTQHRPIPSNFNDLLALRREEPVRDEHIYNNPDMAIEEISVSGADGPLPAIVLKSKSQAKISKSHPGILFFHGGGRVMGNVYVGLAAVSEFVKELDAIIVSVGYRLSPDFPGIAAVEDCYSSLVWMSENLSAFDIDPSRFIVAGVSAGAGLAAGALLMSRDRKGPNVAAQLLVCPMLDDRFMTLSSRQFENGRGFYTAWGRYAWNCVLGEDTERGDVSYYLAPGRAQDLSDLPPAYIDAGSGEPFRDEDIAYATKLWECGVQADLHIWGGGCHGFDLFFPTELGAQAVRARDSWLRRVLKGKSGLVL
ncbi:Alpha/Beta hydrolase protein [Xylaria telfairii]|nr:Alpha/Beta hydrolase protein [Xylaria telfairii]